MPFCDLIFKRTTGSNGQGKTTKLAVVDSNFTELLWPHKMISYLWALTVVYVLTVEPAEVKEKSSILQEKW